ncbi:MAG: cryptochrome/photolyase family protein [Ilumatobacteraceae bacterium]
MALEVAGTMGTSIIWFRRDLRLADHPALHAALAHGTTTPLFVLDPLFVKRSGAARMAFMLRNLRALDVSMNRAVVVRHGDPLDIVPRFAKEVGADKVFISADFAPYGSRRDNDVEARLKTMNVELVRVGSPYAVNPGTVRKPDGTPYAVFTPFSRGWIAHGWDAPLPAPTKMNLRGAPDVKCDGIPAEPSLQAALPGMPSGGTDVALPVAGEQAAWARWEHFASDALSRYKEERNNPDRDGCSMLSPYLRFGVLHPRQLLAELKPDKNHDHYRSELGWREFYADVLHHQPHTTWKNLQPKMSAMPVDTDAKAKQRFALWCEGRTGYPIVDAGMRQMLATGWMHNRVRMIVASFLVKDLHLPWQWGAKFFMMHLVDGDIASNNHGWQWTAGTGTDAAPYFRIFNPAMQAEKFDPTGAYVRTWIPELQDVPDKFVHTPAENPAGVPKGYVAPMVDHGEERDEALRRYKLVTGK